MKAGERRRRLLEIISAGGMVEVSKAAEMFGVSKMTIHRDLALLEKEGRVRRVFGGAVAVDQGPATPSKSCIICSRPGPGNLRYIITLTGRGAVECCCPHCGLVAHITYGADISLALATDFLTSIPFTASQGSFVAESRVVPCCSPSILAFRSLNDARSFASGFGGRVFSFSESLSFLGGQLGPDHSLGCCHREGV